MNNASYGPSIYFATDKNIFDALNEHKIDAATITELFLDRNTIVSSIADRVDLSRKFSRLQHDYFDHKKIASRLGVVPRRERITATKLLGKIEIENIRKAVEVIKNKFEASGDTVSVSKVGDGLVVLIQYSKIDYRRSEFNQVQRRDGVLEIMKSTDSVLVRSTQNSYIDGVRDSLVAALKSEVNGLVREDVSLFDYPDAQIRSRFFYDLFSKLPGYAFRDVTDLYVYKPTVGDLSGDVDVDSPQVERVALRGNQVSNSKIFTSLAKDGYYTVRVGWQAVDQSGKGHLYSIEVVFSDPVGCTGLSYVLLAVNERDETKGHRKARRSPTRGESEELSKAIEARARELIKILKNGAASSTEKDAETSLNAEDYGE
ncbi:hypothetical protein VDF98_21565 [Xanthomonas campestris pv. raphani]|nr:hypothetical protein [Xanthomonas campestris]MEA9854288.1 hypothetical protein [Xanthomonas campestris pv. raphani]MEA9858480.1 hypothetical protein [Xanthomonas campestris pv. raphani]WDJ23027.1 hypothetical protein JH270_03385 [Xanthomonas campestris pv. raphani]